MRRLTLVLALFLSACGGGCGSAAPIPDGWSIETERFDLAFGEWRFYELEENEPRSSAPERNFVARGDESMSGEAGIAALIADEGLRSDPSVVRADVVAAQLAMFLVEGTSRSSASFTVVDVAAAQREYTSIESELHAPETVVHGDELVHRSWIEVATGVRHLVVRVDASGHAHVDFGPNVVRG
jgi:hypothetical protein